MTDARRASLPVDYNHSVLVTVWNENSIERFDVEPKGGSITSSGRKLFLTGGKDFRPVAIDCDSRGNIFVTDWMLVDYPNHGRGRIWRISTKPDAASTDPQSYFSEPIASEDVTEFQLVENGDSAKLTEALESDFPFLQHAAQMLLAKDDLRSERDSLMRHKSAKVRLGALLASKRSDLQSPDSLIRRFLADKDSEVRRAALMWAGESMLTELRDDLDGAINQGDVDATLFETYLAAVENLNGDFSENVRLQTARRANTLRRQLPAGLIASVAEDSAFPNEVRVLAIDRLTDAEVAGGSDWLSPLLSEGADALSIAVARRFASMNADR
ncbi:hypothetical protein CEE69_01040 [Rhodopirellula bahusiensis]|uniref:Uncharacterized protein n=1 Tax=Rhodopirellula bahusiensis TaxID=2014065 RepID=A0A2G1WD76_9BACT|nr:hypothetical protein CEE69_01040 [Rhodopirellula bahusiensis]